MRIIATVRNIGIFVAVAFSTSLAALTYKNTMSLSSMSAQDVPKTLSPLKVEPDANEVNIATGQTVIPMPTLSIPADPNLKFDRVQNAAPYFVGKLPVTQEPDVSNGNYSIHTGEAGSESFKCDYGGSCQNIMATGSTFLPYNRLLRQAGSGVTYFFNRKFVDTKDRDSVRTRVYYATKITYPNGQTIDISYATFVQSSDPLEAVLVRPTRLTSSLGYYIDITYITDDGAGGAWGVVKDATLYSSANPATPLAKHTYAGGTSTDLAGRTFECLCQNQMDAPMQTADGTLKLPGETTFAREFTSIPSNNYVAPRMIASAKRDGVSYNYSYQNVVFDSTSLSNFYTGVTVTGPNGYSRVYSIQPGVQLAPVNLIKSVTNELGQVTSYTYDGFNRVNSITRPEGNKEQITYDAYGNVSAKVMKGKPGSGVADITESAFVDTTNCVDVLCYRPVWTRDGLGRQTDYVYNAAGQVTERTDPADAAGVRRKTFTTYDATLGISRPTVVRVCGTGAACGSTSEIRTEYSYWGNTLLPLQERRIDAANGLTAVTDYTYDAAGRMLSVDGPLPGADDAVYFRYDVVGRKTWEIAAKGPNGKRKTMRFTYRNADDKVITTEIGTIPDPANTVFTPIERTDVTYDSRRNPAKTVRSAGGTSYAVLDQFFTDRGQLQCSAVRMNPAAFAATPGACTLGVAGAHGPDRITMNSYDLAGQLLKKQVAVGTTDQSDEVTYTYTPNGKASSVADGMGNLTTYEFDSFDRLAKTRFPVAANGATSSTTDYEGQSYDAVGNVTQRRLRDSQLINYTYDNLNNMIAKDVPNSVSHEYDVSYQFDLLGRMVRATDSNTHFTARSYDALSRMTSEQSNYTTRSYQYDLAGRKTRLTWGDGFYIDYSRYASGDVSAVRENGAMSGSGVLATYGYDDLGRMTSLTRGNGVASNYSYDSVSRLSQLGHDMAGTTHDVTWGFTYNPASQIVSSTRSNDVYAWNGHGNVDRDYGTNSLNQLTTAGATALSYDGRGNLTNMGTVAYRYTSENRLASGPNFYEVAYDPVGRLFWVWNYANAQTWMQYDGDQIIEERGGIGVLRRYVYGPGADTPLVWYEGAGTTDKRWLIPDERGSIIAVTNASGNVTNINSYDEYGVPASTNVGRFQYTGQAWLPELQLYYYKARIYAPTLGRFMQTDPTGYDDGPNWYDYVGSDPINHTDPTGLECNKERTSCSADNALNSRAQDVRHNAQSDAAVVAARKQFQSPTKQGGEPTGTVTGSTVTSAASKAGQTSTADTAKFSLGKADAGVHGHLGGSVTDVPKANGGYGDTQSLTQGKPMYTVEGNRVGVHDSPGGVMRFEMVGGKMTGSEAKAIQRNLDEAQKRFNRVRPPE